MFYASCRALTHGILRLVFRLEAAGVGYVPTEGPAILASNHLSLFDPAVVGAPLARELHYMAKAELFRVPLFGGLIRALNAHPVDRSGSDAAALRLALRLLDDGQALLVFPEGTRGAEPHFGHAQAGAGMLAALSRAPVVPVLLAGTGRVLPRGAVWPRPARISVTYSRPLRFGKERGKARYQAISDEIMAAIGRLRDDRRPVKVTSSAAARVTQMMAQTDPGNLSPGRIH